VEALWNTPGSIPRAIGRGQIDEAPHIPGLGDVEELRGQLDIGELQTFFVKIIYTPRTMNDLVNMHCDSNLVQITQTVQCRQFNDCDEPHELVGELFRYSTITEPKPYVC
jgi:hypothetical protein